ncbi:hypothetical protein CIT27_03810 [Photobacterium carnosum]|nr:hypothetical protein CIT27_03810 [Photobacterium carnosum]
MLFNEGIRINNRLKIIALSVNESKITMVITSLFCNQDHLYNIQNEQWITIHKKSSDNAELFEKQ